MMMIIFQASYGVEDAEFAITQLAQTTMRSEIGKIVLDTVFRERELLNIAIVGVYFAKGCFTKQSQTYLLC